MILLIRHGEAEHHVKALTGGWTDSCLTADGKVQMEKLAAVLKKDFAGRKPPRLAASDLQRCQLGAAILKKALGIKEMILFEALREKNNGKAAGKSVIAAKAFYHAPKTGRELDHRNYDEGETRREFYERTIDGIKDVLSETEDLIIVAHKGSIQNILFYWMGYSIDEVAFKKVSFDIRPASLTMIGINKWDEHAIFLLNDLSYLRSDEKIGLFDFPIKR